MPPGWQCGVCFRAAMNGMHNLLTTHLNIHRGAGHPSNHECMKAAEQDAMPPAAGRAKMLNQRQRKFASYLRTTERRTRCASVLAYFMTAIHRFNSSLIYNVATPQSPQYRSQRLHGSKSRRSSHAEFNRSQRRLFTVPRRTAVNASSSFLHSNKAIRNQAGCFLDAK